jgi:hypothetical protein
MEWKQRVNKLAKGRRMKKNDLDELIKARSTNSPILQSASHLSDSEENKTRLFASHIVGLKPQ